MIATNLSPAAVPPDVPVLGVEYDQPFRHRVQRIDEDRMRRARLVLGELGRRLGAGKRLLDM